MILLSQLSHSEIAFFFQAHPKNFPRERGKASFFTDCQTLKKKLVSLCSKGILWFEFFLKYSSTSSHYLDKKKIWFQKQKFLKHLKGCSCSFFGRNFCLHFKGKKNYNFIFLHVLFFVFKKKTHSVQLRDAEPLT